MKAILFRVFKIVISVGLLAVLIYRAGLGAMSGVFRSADMAGLLVALLVYISTIVLISWRWQLLLVAQRARVSYGRLLSLYFIGFFFNNFLPTSIGGDIYRALGAGRESGKKAISAASVLAERLMGMLAVSVLAIFALILVQQQVTDVYIQFLTIGFGATMVLLLALFFSRPAYRFLEVFTQRVTLWGVGRKLSRLYQALILYRRQKGVLALAFFISLIYQLLIVVFSYLVGQALGLGISLRYFMLCVPITVIISLVPISINGVGVRETGYVFLLSKIGHGSSEAVSLSLLIFGLSLLASLTGGVLYLVRGTRSPQFEDPSTRGQGMKKEAPSIDVSEILEGPIN